MSVKTDGLKDKIWAQDLWTQAIYQTDSDNWYEEEHENSNGNSISMSISISISISSSSRSSSSNSNIIHTIYITTKHSFALIWCYDNYAWVQHMIPWTMLILLYWTLTTFNVEHAFKVPKSTKATANKMKSKGSQ